MNRRTERICCAVALATVAAIGVLDGSRGGAAAEAGGDQERENPRDARGARQASHERSGELRPGRDDQELRRLVDHALSTPNRTERYQRLMQMLDRTTRENWQVLWQEYIRQTLEEGRVHEHEWSLFMNRVGELAGAAGMEYFTHNGQNEYTFNRREVLTGWAAADPEGAYGWLTSQPEDAQPPEFWSAVLRGASARDAALTLTWLGEVPHQHAPGITRQVVDSLIQAEGIGNTAKSLLEMMETSGGSPPQHLTMFYAELKARAERMIWLSRSYPNVDHRPPDLTELDAVFGQDGAPPDQ